MRTSSAGLRPPIVSGTVDIRSSVSVAESVVVLGEEDSATADRAKSRFLRGLGLRFCWGGGEEEDISEGGMVMQSKEIFFPFPALRAATHNSATSSRLMRVISPLVLALEVMFLPSFGSWWW